jgi:hypothetical protein
MTPTLYKRYLSALYNTISHGDGEWSKIVESIKNHGLEPVKPMNWLDVRGVLAGLQNGGFVVRTASTKDEIYVLTEKGKELSGRFKVTKKAVKYEYRVN